MYKRIVLLVCLIIGVSFVCIGNNFSKDNAQQKVTIQFSSWGSESELRILKPILIDFEKENPDIKVEFLHIPQNYFQKLHLLFASNTAPDVLFINNQYLPVYANTGVLENLAGYGFELDDFYSKSVEALSWEDKNYGIPRDMSNLVIYYNKEIFDDAGIPYPNNNWTVEEFLSIAKGITKNSKVFGVSFEDEPLYYLPYLTTFGAFDFDNFDDFKMQKGLKFYADLRGKYHVAPRKEEAASATMAQMFLQGKLGMYLSGRWMVPKFREEAKFDWDVAEFPKNGADSVIPLDASGWAVAKSSKHKTQAVKLIKYLASKESSEKFTRSGLIVPARIEVANSENFLDGSNPKNAKVFLTSVQNSIPTPVSVNFREVLDNLKIKTEYMFNMKK